MRLVRFIHKLQLPLFLAILFGIVAVAGLLGFILGQRGGQQNTPAVSSATPSSDLLGEIDKLYKLPTDEKPTIVTIKDADKLKDQTFFKDAKNGDRLVVYSNNKLALIYRQADHSLVNVGPVNYNETSK